MIVDETAISQYRSAEYSDALVPILHERVLAVPGWVSGWSNYLKFLKFLNSHARISSTANYHNTQITPSCSESLGPIDILIAISAVRVLWHHCEENICQNQDWMFLQCRGRRGFYYALCSPTSIVISCVWWQRLWIDGSKGYPRRSPAHLRSATPDSALLSSSLIAFLPLHRTLLLSTLMTLLIIDIKRTTKLIPDR